MTPVRVANPPNPWSSTDVEWIGEPPAQSLEVFEERAKSILSENDSPDVGFRFSVNPYRGCFHACAYCYARPSHQYLGFGAGTDFDRKIVVKVDAPERLREAFMKPSWKGDFIAFSGNTDCYQPLEASYELTRRCLAVCLEFRNPLGVVTKGALVRRDVDLLAALAKRARVGVSLSIPFATDEMARKIEPFASSIAARFETMRRLADAGVRTGINVAPIIPGLNDGDIPELLERAHAAGARRASMIAVRLAAEVLPVFLERLAEAYPARVAKVKHALYQIRGGKMNDARFGARMTGQGPRWHVVEQLFETQCQRLGLEREWQGAGEPSTFRRPSPQGTLFDD